MPVALVTGASRGLGRAAARELAGRGWSVIVDARRRADLADTTRDLPRVVVIPGDVTDPGHRADLVAAVERLGHLDVLLNNATPLRPSPPPPPRNSPPAPLGRVSETNGLAPLALIQLLAAPIEAAHGTLINVTSDAAVEPYPGWGGYGSSKAALDQLTNVLAAEESELRCYAFDPGDMRTGRHQPALPGEDISDRAAPESVVPALLRLIDDRPPSGRYRATDLTIEFPAEVNS